MHLNWIITLYLCVQSMIALASLEVAYRYSRWYFATAKSEGLLLRSLILGIAVTHIAIFGDNVSWVYERVVSASIMDNFMGKMQGLYLRLDVLRSCLYFGVIVHLIPIWRIVYRYNNVEIFLAVVVRIVLALSIYAGVLHYNGVLGCYMFYEIACSK